MPDTFINLTAQSAFRSSVTAVSDISVMQLGDSLCTGSSPAPGGSRIELWRRARAAGMPVRFVGPVNQANVLSTTDLRPEPGDPFCAGYPGETIAQLTTRCQSGGSIYTYVTTYGAPDVIFVGSIGTNDANAGTSASTMWSAMQTLLGAIATMCPNAKIVVESIPLFYTGSAPTGGIAAANVVVAAFNALIAANISSLGSRFSYLDAVAGFTIADTFTDGTHLRPEGQAKKGVREFAQLVSLFPGAVLSSETVPRPARLRTAVPLAKFTATTDKLELTVADDGWRIPAANFLLGGWFMFSTLPAVYTNLMYSAPLVQNYTNGFQLSFDGLSSPKTLNIYTSFGGASVVLNKQTPIVAGRPFFVAAHGDRTLGIVSIWVAVQERGMDAPWTVYCLGEATGISAWSASPASPKVHLGNYVDPGHVGAVGGVFMASGVPGRAAIRAEIERIVYDGVLPQGITAYIPATEGTGTTAASSVGGQSATLTGGGWYAAGDLWRGGDDKAPTVTGSKGANAALTSLCTQLAALGLITDATS